jgi:hypothetical protein
MHSPIYSLGHTYWWEILGSRSGTGPLKVSKNYNIYVCFDKMLCVLKKFLSGVVKCV